MDFSNASSSELLSAIIDGSANDLYLASNRLAKLNTDEIRDELIKLLHDEKEETRYLAARTLGKMENRPENTAAILEVLEDKNFPYPKGDMAEALLELDCSEKFVAVFKLFLFGSMKVSAMAKVVLDSEEFDLRPRDLRKAEKHWNHFCNNTKQDEEFELIKEEVEDILGDLRELFSEED